MAEVKNMSINKKTTRTMGKILLIMLVMQLMFAGTAFAFVDIEFDKSTWFDIKVEDDWWVTFWDEDFSTSSFWDTTGGTSTKWW